MQYGFPANLRIRAIRPRLERLRHSPFTNIDGETFAKPSLNGVWRVEVDIMAGTEPEFLALNAFLTAMRGPTTTVLPMTTAYLPNNSQGRRLNGYPESPEFTTGHVGFSNTPFGGFTLRASAAHRDSYIDVNKPALSHLWAGHFVTLDDRLYQVTNVTPISTGETACRVSVMPNIRGNHSSGKVVVVDHLKLRCMMESAGDPQAWNIPTSEVTATFIEAF